MIDLPDRFRMAIAERYTVESVVGAGGMATVYLAIDRKHQRKVALKVLRPDYGAAVGQERFLREIDTLSHLNHPHVLPLLDSGASDGLFYFVMPFCEGETLRELLDRDGQLPIDDVLRFASEIADALAHAHAHGVVHRDVKPQNVMLESGHAVLADFGVAVAMDAMESDRLTRTGLSPGTPHYMSPEQAGGDPRVDARSDIYSLGCVIFEMLTGKPPFPGPNLMAILARHALEPPPDIRTLRDTVSESLERLVFRTLAKAPADRFRTAGELRDALTAVAHERVRLAGSDGASPVARPHAAAPTKLAGRAASARPDLPPGVRVAAGIAGFVALLGAIGFLTVTAFDLKVGMPAHLSPSRSDFLVVGARALFMPVVTALLLLGSVMLIRFVLRLLFAVGRSTKVGTTTAAAVRRARSRWHAFWDSARPETAADAFFVGAVLSSALMLAVSWPLLRALFTSETAILGCAERPFQRTLHALMTTLVVVLALTWHRVWRWMRRRGALTGTGAARWGSAAVILTMLIVTTLPWRVMWAAGNERIRIGAERGYVLRETDTQLLVYNADRQTTTLHEKNGSPGIERLGVPGHLFEEAAVFESGMPECRRY